MEVTFSDIEVITNKIIAKPCSLLGVPYVMNADLAIVEDEDEAEYMAQRIGENGLVEVTDADDRNLYLEMFGYGEEDAKNISHHIFFIESSNVNERMRIMLDDDDISWMLKNE